MNDIDKITIICAKDGSLSYESCEKINCNSLLFDDLDTTNDEDTEFSLECRCDCGKIIFIKIQKIAV